jgi:hypothetical protein
MSEAIAALVAVFLTAGFALIRDWLTVRRDERVRKQQAAGDRVRFERDIIGELLVGLHLWVNSVANRKYAIERQRKGQGEINLERFQKYLADEETFRAILARARVSVQNPQARPHIDALREQLLIMSRLVSAATEGYGYSNLEARFETFQGVAGEANRELEKAALQWDGTAPHASA